MFQNINLEEGKKEEEKPCTGHLTLGWPSQQFNLPLIRNEISSITVPCKMEKNHMYIMLQASILITQRKPEFNYTYFTSSRKCSFFLIFLGTQNKHVKVKVGSELLIEFVRSYVIKFQGH
jgi:hypothetical protein